MNLADWQRYRQKFREQVQGEIAEAVDAGRGALPINIAIQDAIMRNVLDRLEALESAVKLPTKR